MTVSQGRFALGLSAALLLAAGSEAAPSAGDYPNCMKEKVDSISKRNAEYRASRSDMTVVEPAPGRAEVGRVKINYCSRVPTSGDRDCPPDKRRVLAAMGRAVGGAEHSGFHNQAIGRVLGGSCDFPTDPAFEEQVGYAVQLWVNNTGQSPEDALESMVLRANVDTWKSGLESGCSKLTVDEEASPAEVAKTKAIREAVGCNTGHLGDLSWYIDTGDQPSSELFRLAYTLQCVRPYDMGFDPNNKHQWVKVGICGQDVRAVDLAKVNAETAKMPPPLQAAARENVAAVKARFGELEEVVRAKANSDPDYKRLLFDAPKAGWDAWVAEYRKYKKPMDDTYAFEAGLFGPRLDAITYCYKALEAGVKDFFKKSKFKTRDQVVAAMKGPIGYTLMNALGACYAVVGPWDAGVALLNATKESRVWRGPRAAAGYAMTDAVADIRANRPRFPIEPQWVYPDLQNPIVKEARLGERSQVPNGGNHPDMTEGVVKVAKKWAKQKDAMKIDFKTESWMEKVVMCRDTKQIDRIENGKVHYRKTCQSKGNQKKQFTPKSTLFWLWSTAGIKPNAFVVAEVPPGSEYGNRLRWGFPIEVYTNKKKTKLVSMYGFKL